MTNLSKPTRYWWLVIICIVVNLTIAAVIFTLTPSFTTGNDDESKLQLCLQLPAYAVFPGKNRKHFQISNERSYHHIRTDNMSKSAQNTNPLAELMPRRLRETAFNLPVRVTADEFRSDPSVLTGNPLIDTYGQSDLTQVGELGRGVVLVGPEKDEAQTLQKEFNINVLVSDLVSLNRMVPDSRMKGCGSLTYTNNELSVSVIVPFHNEWPSVLLRTVYSIINRTPRTHLKEILLVDDCSDDEVLGHSLEQYLQDYFPRDLVRLVRMPKRMGLIQARMSGFSASSGDVLVFLDSHMEVNVDWLQPLLAQIVSDRRTVAMAALDYINASTLQYNYYRDSFVAYGFDWRLFFFEVYPKQDSEDSSASDSITKPVPGALMVGSAFAIDRKYFEELGGYDAGMEIWGGENIEMSWRVWMCGGRMIHVPCSHVGHIARAQPYKFPAGMHMTKLRNYKRAAEMWMGPYKKFLYENYPELKTTDPGDLSEREALRDRLHCPHNFTWYLDTLWPQLTVYDQNVFAWGSVVNNSSRHCLDNRLFMGPLGLYTDPCHFHLLTQGFSLTTEGVLRTTIHCAVVPASTTKQRPTLTECIVKTCDRWHHTQEGFLVHNKSGLCLDEDQQGLVMAACDINVQSQKWYFTNNAPFL